MRTLSENHSSEIESTSQPAFCSVGLNQLVRRSIMLLPKSTRSCALRCYASTLKTSLSLTTSLVVLHAKAWVSVTEQSIESNLSFRPLWHSLIASITEDLKLSVWVFPLLGVPSRDPCNVWPWNCTSSWTPDSSSIFMNRFKCPFGTGRSFKASMLAIISWRSYTATERIKSFLCIFRRNFEIIANMSARKWQNAANLMLLIFSLTNFARPFMSAFFDVALRRSIWHNTAAYWPEPSEFGVIKTLSARLMWGSHLVSLTCVGFSTLTPNLLPMACSSRVLLGL